MMEAMYKETTAVVTFEGELCLEWELASDREVP